MSLNPGIDSFREYFDKGLTQLIWHWIPADLDTPVSAYLKLCHDQPYSFLLESVEGGAVLGRYSAIGYDPDLIWKYKNQKDTDPLSALSQHLEDSKIDVIDEAMPPMAASGLFGYLGYGMITHIEDIPDHNEDDLNIPDAVMIRPKIMLIFDNVKSMICVCMPIREHSKNSERSAAELYDQAKMHLKEVLKTLDAPLAKHLGDNGTQLNTPLQINQNTDKNQYMDSVKKAVEYIQAGDIFQVVPSLRFSVSFDLPSFELYRALRRINPSPFLFHLRLEEFSIVGSSPEILVRVRDSKVTIRPIAGTRKRGKNALQDQELAEDLLSDPKERAEHLMLLDLGRNDVGRVSEIGTVNVTQEFHIEYYSHVMHIVSNVEGELAKNKSPLDALFSGFPAGTVSGAPKIRAIEIIDELEPVRRSFYGGCIGYLDGHGDVDTCIALRTALVKDGKIYMQAGAGVVADSDPESEYNECCNKARAIIDAAELAIESAHLKKQMAD